MYTRKQLCNKLKLADSSLRALLSELDIMPQKVGKNIFNRPVYYYADDVYQQIFKKLVKIANQKEERTNAISTCKTCKQHSKNKLHGGQCLKCSTKKKLLNIATNDHATEPNEKLILFSIAFLKSLINK